MADIPQFSKQTTDGLVKDFGIVGFKEIDALRTGNNGKIDLVDPAVAGNIPILTALGALQDSGKSLPTGDIVGTTDIQTLTNKTLTAPIINDLGADLVCATANITLTAGTLTANIITDGAFSTTGGTVTGVVDLTASGTITAANTILNGSTEPMLKITDSGASNNNREWFQIFNKDSVKMVEFGSIPNGNPEMRFGDADNTRVGFPVSDPTYFAFINDETEFWLGNAADPTLYFNYYVGANEYHGAISNRQSVAYWLTSFSFLGNHSQRKMDIIPNTANGQPVEFSFGTVTTGIWIDDNKKLFFGTGKDSSVYYDGSDIIINPQDVGTGGLRILSMKSGATQAAAGAAVDELWKTASHATLPDNVMMIGV